MPTRPGQCKLCLADPVDLQNSHIFPKWMFRQLGEPAVIDGTAMVLTSKQPREHLLCFDCEQRLSHLDGFAKAVTQPDDGRLHLSSLLGRRSVLEDFSLAEIPNGAALKLARFALSVFWRAHVASGFALDLGDSIAEPCRRSLLNEGQELDYVCVVCWYFEKAEAEAPDHARIFSLQTQRDGAFLFICCGLVFSLVGRPEESPLAQQLTMLPAWGDPKVVVAETDLLKYFYEQASSDAVPKGALARRRKR